MASWKKVAVGLPTTVAAHPAAYSRATTNAPGPMFVAVVPRWYRPSQSFVRVVVVSAASDVLLLRTFVGGDELCTFTDALKRGVKL